MHINNGQHISAPVAGSTLSNGPTVRTLSVTRSMCLHITTSCKMPAV